MNPILPLQYFVPDVEARVWADGHLYLYGSLDLRGNDSYCSHEYRVFSSADMVQRADHGISLRTIGPGAVPWTNALWYAPDLRGIEPVALQVSLLNEKEHGFHEGASIRKRPCIASRTPFGPYTKQGVIVDNLGFDHATWNNHGSMCKFRGQWYVFYHRSSHGTNAHRRVCVEPIQFDVQSQIASVEMTTQGARAAAGHQLARRVARVPAQRQRPGPGHRTRRRQHRRIARPNPAWRLAPAAGSCGKRFAAPWPRSPANVRSVCCFAGLSSRAGWR